MRSASLENSDQEITEVFEQPMYKLGKYYSYNYMWWHTNVGKSEHSIIK